MVAIMKKIHLRILSAVLYILSAGIFAYYLRYTLAAANFGVRMILLCLGCAGVYFGSLSMSKTVSKKGSRRLMTITFSFFFGVYILFILSLTLFDRLQGRDPGSLIWRDTESFILYLNTSCNFIPFRSIIRYFTDFFAGKIGAAEFATNFFGNIVAFMPFAFFSPLFFSSLRGRKKFLLSMVINVAVIELLQMAFFLGECDIDDLILNVGGAWALFEILQYPKIQAVIKRITIHETQV